jgi:cobaltochelatase CobN
MRHVVAAAALLVLTMASGVAQSTVPPAAGQVGFIGVWDRAQPMIDAAARELGVSVSFWRPEQILGDDATRADADRADILFLLNLSPDESTPLRDRLREMRAARPALRIVPLDTRGSHADLAKAGLLDEDPEVPRYWRANGALNIKRLMRYASVTYLGASGPIEPAVVVPDFGYYDLDREEAFETFAAYRDFKRARGRWIDGGAVAALLIQQSFWVTRDTKVIDAQIRALERQRVNPVVIFADRQGMAVDLLKAASPDLIVEDRHGAMWDSREVLEELDVPYLRPISMLGYTIDEWRKDPAGLSSRDVGMFMTLQESWGTIEPVVVGGLAVNIGGFHLHEPVLDGVEKFARRAANWVKLRRTPPAEKKLAIVYYSKGLGKDDLMRGSPTGAFLNGPESFQRLLPHLRARGYRIDGAPQSAEALVARMRAAGRNIGPWAQSELETLVDAHDPVLIPLSTYRRWFETRLSAASRAEVIKAFGPPPGKIMVVARKGEPHVVIPRLAMGNLLIAPQPERGEKQDEKLLHTRDTPPPHNYLAFYWWLEEEFKANAVVHWGTHGSLELLPGKEAGLTRDSWSDIVVGDLPVINLWIMDNVAEATLSRRRSYAALVDHLPPPALAATLPEALRNLQEDVRKFQALDTGVLKEQYRKQIAQAAALERIDETLALPKRASYDNAQVAQIAEYLQELTEEKTPTSLHTLGEPMPRADQPAYLVSILGRSFLDHLSAASPRAPSATVPAHESDEVRRAHLRQQGIALVTAVLFDGQPPSIPLSEALRKDLDFARNILTRLNDTAKEIAGLLRALDGRYLTPGPGPDPIRNPSSAPGGRNLYALNPEEIPTQPSWALAQQLVDELLRKKPLRKVGMDLNGMDTMRDFGVMEGQILYLMGVRPVWDRNNLAVDVELIPREELKRPRVDVFIAMGGQYKENFSTRVELIDKAVRLAASADEPDNYVRLGTLENETKLRARGLDAARADLLAPARIFGTKQGNMSGTNILYLIPRSGVWDHDAEVADVYIDNMSWVYTKGAWGEKIDGLYEQAIQGTEALVRNWASNMTSQLSNHHAYEYLGGLSMAVKKLTGKEPEAFIADVRDPDGARMRGFNEVLATSFRSELLNPAWIAGMKAHGYAGAGHAAELVKNTFGWSVTRGDAVSDSTWNEIYAVYVEDKLELGVREWMDTANPHALQEMVATMLEASRKGYWQADAKTVAHLASTYRESVARHGDSNGLVSGGNKALEEYAGRYATAPGTSTLASASAGDGSAETSSAPPAGSAPQSDASVPVVGQRLARSEHTQGASAASANAPTGAALAGSLAAIALALVATGFIRREGSL